MDELHRNKDLRIQCQRHDGYFITHGCAFSDCSREILFCSQCLLEHLDHANEHKAYIYPLNRFIIEFYENVSNIKEQLRPFEEVHNTRDSHIQFYNKFINEQKDYINIELRNIIEQFQFMVEKIRMQAFTELDTIERQLVNHYDGLSNVFHSTEIAQLNINHHIELAHKMQILQNNQVVPFLLNLRNCFQNLKDPMTSGTVRNAQKIIQAIHGYKKKNEKSALALNSLCAKLFKQLYGEIEERIQDYLNDSAKPLDPTTGNLSQQDYTQQSPGRGRNINNLNHINNQNQSPLKNPLQTTSRSAHNQYNQVSPQNINHLRSISPKQVHQNSQQQFTTTSKSLKKVQYSPSRNEVFDYNNPVVIDNVTNQKNFIFQNEVVNLNKGSVLNLEALFEVDSQISALCVASLSESMIAVGCKDNNIRLFKLLKQAPNKCDLRLVSILNHSQDPSAVWSLCKLNPSSSQFYSGTSKGSNQSIYFAAGCENGNINIWKFDPNYYKKFESKPSYQLKGGHLLEIVTALIDLEGGSHHLISGDCNGTLMLWDYLNNRMIQKFHLHNGQINTVCLYNNSNNIAVGGYDGIISLWDIIRKNNFQNDEQIVEIQCKKLITNNFYIYSMISMPTKRNPVLMIVDSQKKLKTFDINSQKFVNETDRVLVNEPILDLLSIENTGDVLNKNQSYVLCFTKTQMFIADSLTLEPIQYFDNNDFYNNNIGFTMCANHKVVFLPREKFDNNLYFAIIDQSNHTNRILSIFSLQI